MNNTTAFETTDFIQYMSLDVMDELRELEEHIDNKAKQYRYYHDLNYGYNHAFYIDLDACV